MLYWLLNSTLSPTAYYLVEDSDNGPVTIPRKKYALFKTFKSGFVKVIISKTDTISHLNRL